MSFFGLLYINPIMFHIWFFGILACSSAIEFCWSHFFSLNFVFLSYEVICQNFTWLWIQVVHHDKNSAAYKAKKPDPLGCGANKNWYWISWTCHQVPRRLILYSWICLQKKMTKRHSGYLFEFELQKVNTTQISNFQKFKN